MNNKIKIILPLILVSSSAFILFKVKTNSYNSTTTQGSNIKSTDQATTPTTFQKLIVQANRCIGCGRCAGIDPSHFQIINNISTVISSTNLNSQNLTLAINNCPVQAISLQ